MEINYKVRGKLILPNNAHFLSELIHSDTHMLVSTKMRANGPDPKDEECLLSSSPFFGIFD